MGPIHVDTVTGRWRLLKSDDNFKSTLILVDFTRQNGHAIHETVRLSITELSWHVYRYTYVVTFFHLPPRCAEVEARTRTTAPERWRRQRLTSAERRETARGPGGRCCRDILYTASIWRLLYCCLT